MNIYFVIGAIIIALLAFVGFVLFSIDNHKNHFNVRYDFRNYYPYELNYEMRFKENIVGNSLLFLSVLGSLATFITGLFLKQDAFSMVISIVGMLTAFAPLLLVFIPLSKGKAHIVAVCISFMLVFISNGVLAIGSYRYFNRVNLAYGLVSFIISALICLFVFVMIMNPKLTKWSTMIEKKQDDGTIVYERPKYFVLAFSEWLLIFANLLTLLSYFFYQMI